MVTFIVGMLVGGVVTMAILGFLAVVAEDEERQEQSRRKQTDPWQWHMEDDGK